jgi:predicted MFS family arabinose efflux permease
MPSSVKEAPAPRCRDRSKFRDRLERPQSVVVITVYFVTLSLHFAMYSYISVVVAITETRIAATPPSSEALVTFFCSIFKYLSG